MKHKVSGMAHPKYKSMQYTIRGLPVTYYIKKQGFLIHPNVTGNKLSNQYSLPTDEVNHGSSSAMSCIVIQLSEEGVHPVRRESDTAFTCNGVILALTFIAKHLFDLSDNGTGVQRVGLLDGTFDGP